jgi:hypothetical protein
VGLLEHPAREAQLATAAPPSNGILPETHTTTEMHAHQAA